MNPTLKPVWLITFLLLSGFDLFSCMPPTTIQPMIPQPVIIQMTAPPPARLETSLSASRTQYVFEEMNAPSPTPLASFYHSLNRLPNHKPVNILHLGDSHTAGDQFSGRLRQLFQTQFGSAGRGMLTVGKPYHYFQPTHVSISQTQGWQVSNSHTAPDDGPYGLSGFRIQSRDPNDAITLTMTDGTQFDAIDLEFLRRPNTGTIVVELDDGRTRFTIATVADSQYVDHYTITVAGGGSQIKISPLGDGPIELLAWTFKRNQSGIIYHSHGIVSATINVINHWSRNVVSWELEQLDPSLIIVAFGTNEGFHDYLETSEYARDFQERLALLQNAAPHASIVVVGPPDANRRPNFCDKQIEVGCAPLTPNEADHYAELLAQQDERLCRWHPPPKLEAVRQIQRQVAAQKGYFFWDWSTVMGGTCGTHEWTQPESPLSYQDHVHLTERGYHISAEALFENIMNAYSWKP